MVRSLKSKFIGLGAASVKQTTRLGECSNAWESLEETKGLTCRELNVNLTREEVPEALKGAASHAGCLQTLRVPGVSKLNWRQERAA